MTECNPRQDALIIKQGSMFKKVWPLRDAEGNSIPTDGWTAEGQVRRYKDSDEVLFTFSTTDGSILLTESSIALIVKPAVSSEWEWGEGVYDIEVTMPTAPDDPTRVLEGPVIVNREVTR